MVSSHELLWQYGREGNEDAFRTLVLRHIDLVYSTARRHTAGEGGLAADIAQVVFTDLARKAASFSSGMPVSGWLYRHTCFIARKMIRSENRRRQREQASLDLAPSTSNEAWHAIAPVLDAAMNNLRERDRTALVLRFFDGWDLRAVGNATGTTEDGAQKRISRALEKLRACLARKGVTVPTAALSAALGSNAVSAAPPAIAAAIAGASLAASAPITMGTLAFMANIKTAAVATAIVIGIGIPVFVQFNTVSRLRSENAALRLQLSSAVETTPAVAASSAPVADQTELLRLRGEVARLRAGQPQAVQHVSTTTNKPATAVPLNEPPPAVASFLPRESWADLGHATPQLALQTLGWSIVNGNVQRFKDSVIVTEAARKYLDDLVAQMAQKAGQPEVLADVRARGWGAEEGLLFPAMAQDKRQMYRGFRIQSQTSPSPEETLIELDIETASGQAHKDRYRFKHVDGSWKRMFDIEDLPLAGMPKTR